MSMASRFRSALPACLAVAALRPQVPTPNAHEIPFRHAIIDDEARQAPKFYGDCKAVGDIDGDGYPDIVWAGSVLAWYRYPGWNKTVIAKAGQEFTTDMQAGDMDGDGDLDIVVPDGEKGSIAWFENPRPAADPGNPAKWQDHFIGMQGAWAHDVEVGDVNGDGKLDVLTRKKETLLWLQRGPDSFERIEIAGTLENGEGSALADLNRDGRLDIVQGGYWMECPADPRGRWTRHDIDTNWPRQIAVTAADLNLDGRLDVIVGPAESAGRLVWYEAPAEAAAGRWTTHLIDDGAAYLHTFKAADINNDGVLEVIAAEMHQSEKKRVLVYYRQKGKWQQQAIAATGSHNLRIADIGSDGDIDIVGANWGGPHHPLEMWENLIVDRPKKEPGWSYQQVDARRARWGDFAAPSWNRYFGLAFGDVNGDRRLDIAAGRYFYRNPGREGAPWPRVDFGRNVDAMLITEIGGRAGVIAEALPDVFWMRPRDGQGSAWDAVRIGSVPATEHVNSQGYALAQIVRGGRPEVLLTGAGGIYSFEIPDRPGSGEWRRTRIAADTSEEGIAPADYDGDGLVDVAASGKEGREVFWFRNPGSGAPDWERRAIGKTAEWADRFAPADINGDGRIDVVVAEECAYWGASVYWYENPGKAPGEWKRHTVSKQYSTNAMDVFDVNRDGSIDIITNEHRGSRKLAWWENRGRGSAWVEHVVDTGKEGHLGARPVDLEGNGRLSIASICWDTWWNLHLWRRQGMRANRANPGVVVRRTGPVE
jgi:hypothetical protein